MSKKCANKDIYPLRTGVSEGTYSLTKLDHFTGMPMASVNISGRQAGMRRRGACLRCGPVCNKKSCPKCVAPGACGQQVFTKPLTFPVIPRFKPEVGLIRIEGTTSMTSTSVWSWKE